MESIAAWMQAIETLRCRAREHTEALKALSEIVSCGVENLRRRDLCAYLRDLKERVREEVKHAELTETVASYRFSRSRLTGSLTRLATGTLVAALVRSPDNALLVGLRRAEAELKRTEPFDAVLVGVRPADGTHEVEVIPLSRLARERGRSEAEIRAKLEAGGYLLVEPETFFKAVDRLEEKVLDGTLATPPATSSSSGQQGQDPDHAFVLNSLVQELRPTTGGVWVARRRP
jgi:hypothetical protein